MSRLKLNGVDVGVMIAFNGITRLRREPVGEVRQAFGGGERRDVTSTKRGWRVKTITLAVDVAEALRVLVEGDDEARVCDAISFDLDTWSARGVPASSLSTGVAVSATAAVIGARGLYDGGNRLASAEWAGMVQSGAPWTILHWRRGGPFASASATHHYAVTSAGLLYRDGVISASPSACATVDGTGKLVLRAFDKQENLPTFLPTHAYLAGDRISVVASGDVYIFQVTAPGTSGGTAPVWPTTFNATVSGGSPAVTWRNDGLGGLIVDDVAVLPFAAPAAWLPQLYARHAGPWAAPEITATGSLVGEGAAFSASPETASALVRAKFISGRNVKSRLYGSQGEQLEFELREV